MRQVRRAQPEVDQVERVLLGAQGVILVTEHTIKAPHQVLPSHYGKVLQRP